ncbi:hypothetical protein DEJ43_02855 [Streptomyces venezuelae ATCC 10712]|nr:hypothetical protein DEJ43_02855 [Streptomyces venezuelae ATCC 10712]
MTTGPAGSCVWGRDGATGVSGRRAGRRPCRARGTSRPGGAARAPRGSRPECPAGRRGGPGPAPGGRASAPRDPCPAGGACPAYRP